MDRPFHERSFAAAGVELEYRYWTDGDVAWDYYDLVVIRSLWDYTDRGYEFDAFLDRLAELTTVHNPPELIRWNLDKNYLLDLDRAGVPVVRTLVADDLDEVGAAVRAISDSGSSEVVVKPVVSASSRSTGWFDADDPAAIDLARAILAEGGRVLVEPFIPSVAERGEVAVIMFGGVVSHAIRKGPLLAKGGGLIGGVYREEISPHQPSEAELATATLASDAASRMARDSGWIGENDSLLYGRFDVVELDDGSTALLEAELFEPCLFVPFADGAADRFTRACIDRIGMR